MIAGIIIQGTGAKTVIIRGTGTSLPLPQRLLDPVLELYNSAGGLVASNDDWGQNSNRQEIIDSGIPPSTENEPALLLPLEPGLYTAVLSGKAESTGVALVELYDLNRETPSQVVNISTRGFVQTGDDVMIGGLILTGNAPADVIVRAIGPSLPLEDALSDPHLELFNGQGVSIGSNDDWGDAQRGLIQSSGIAPSHEKESAIRIALPPGNYTAIVSGVGETTGAGLVEVYKLSP
jgi:hypothetical protein